MVFPNVPASLDNYGGTKIDYLAVVNPQFDRTADEVNEALKDVAEMTNTAIQARTAVGNDGYGPVVKDWDSVWLIAPTLTAVSTGVYNIIFPTTFVNEVGDTVSVNINAGWANIRGSTFGFTTVTKLTPNSVQVRLANTSGAANAFTGITVDIWVA